jgi:ribonuclease D
VGGVIIGPRGNVERLYSWNIGHAMNNQVEAYVLYQGLQLVRIHDIDSITLIDDSKFIFNRVRLKSLPFDNILCEMFHRIQMDIESFVESFHILRQNNVDAYQQANLVIQETVGTLKVN